jgi:hypothetical protein
MDLIGTTSSTSFTWLATFGRRHHSLPIIYSVPLHRDYIQVPFFLGLLLSQNFGCSYLYQINLFLENTRQYLIALKNIFATVYNTPQLDPI